MEINEELIEQKRGYLIGDFALFHLKDQENNKFEYHYHDFNKIIIFISGNVSYMIEGKSYKLKPWDILLVNSHQIHKPTIDPGSIYERIVIYINQDFLDRHSTTDSNLSTCFELSSKINCNLLRLNPELISQIRRLLSSLENEYKGSEFGSRILSNSFFIQFLVQLNREFLETRSFKDNSDVNFDERIDSIINFINANLSSDLSIEKISSKFFISKYYLMHKFKMQTGYSLHNYIVQKRLIKANEMLKTGKPASLVSIECGFDDYSSFVRAFKKMFGLSPKNHYKTMKQLEIEYNKQKEPHLTDNPHR